MARPTEDSAAAVFALDHAPVDVLHLVLRKLPAENRVAFRTASRSTRQLSDAATKALAIKKPNLIRAGLASRFPNVKRLDICLEDELDILNASSLEALLQCPLLLQRLHYLHISFTGDWTAFAGRLCNVLLCCTSLRHISLSQSFCNNLVLRHEWTAEFKTNAPGALPTLQHMLTQRAGIHKAFGTPAWCSLLTSLTLNHLMVIPDDPLAPYVLPSPSAATNLTSLTLHTNAGAIPHFLSAPLFNLARLSTLNILIEMRSAVDHAAHPWPALARLHTLTALSIKFIAVDKYPNDPSSADPFPIPHKWSRLTNLQSLTLSAPAIDDLTPLSPLTSLLHLSLSSISGRHPPSLPHLPNLQTLSLSHQPPPPDSQTPACDAPPPLPPALSTLATQLFSCFRPKPCVCPRPPPPADPPTPILPHLPASITSASFIHFPPSLLPTWPNLTSIRTLSLALTGPADTPSLHAITALTHLQTLALHQPELNTHLMQALASLPNLLHLSLHNPILSPLRTPSTYPTLVTLTLHAPREPPRSRSLFPPSHTPLDTLLAAICAPSLTALHLLPPCPIHSLKALYPAAYDTPKPCHFTTLQAFLSLAPNLTPSSISGLPTHFAAPAHLHLMAAEHPSFLATNPLSVSSTTHLGPACATAAAYAPLRTLNVMSVLPGYALRAVCAPVRAAQLTSLSVSMAAMLPGEVCAALAATPRLRVLRLQHATLLSAKPLAQVVTSCPLLEELHLHSSRLRPRSLSLVNNMRHLHTLVLQSYSGSAELLSVVAVLHPQLRPASLKHVAFTSMLATLCDVDWFVTAMPISGMLWAVDHVRVVPSGRKHQDILFELSG